MTGAGWPGSAVGVAGEAGVRVALGPAGADDGARLGTAEAEGARDGAVGVRVPVLAAVLGAAGVLAVASTAGSDAAGGGCQGCWVGSTKGSTVSGLTGPPAKLAATSPV